MKKDVLASIVCIVEAQETKDVPPSWGQALHGLVLRLVRGKNPALSKEWHDSQDTKPFSVSTLFGRFARTATGRKVVTGQQYWFKIGIIGAESFDALGDAIFPRVAVGAEIMISSTRFKLIDAKLTDHNWASLSSWEELDSLKTNGQPVVIRFLTPTTFRRKKANCLIPEPNLIFGSLLNRWNKFAPKPIDDGIKEIFSDILISRYSLTTQTFNLTTQPMLGFRGRCGYEVKPANQELKDTIYKLASLALYSGIGQKTTMGMGVARVEYQ